MTENHHLGQLNDRALITISGPDSGHFLQNVITTDIKKISEEDMLPGALLSPHGKVLFDFLIGYHNGLFFIDIRSAIANAFIRRLNLYRLRANIEIHEKKHAIVDIFQEKLIKHTSSKTEKDDSTLIFNDKRVNKKYNIIRTYYIKNQEHAAVDDTETWDIIRIENGIAESGTDFEPGDVFPHDINYDKINGLSFEKGCYIGQEVISRIQHRGTARKRVLIAASSSFLPRAGTVIEAEGSRVGVLGTVAGTKAIALVRIGQLKALTDAGIPVTAQGIPLAFSLPPNVYFILSDREREL
ncbi:MAG: Folate-binding protein [Candidatus Tokpelaia sp. JSC189]|nr:MAG: Folate-binding protein [Candidatus Tokpelaia sp. JSC189]